MNGNLLVGVLGNRNSGKSHTWNTLFGSEVHTGSNLRRLNLSNNECVWVFLVSGSPEERDKYVGDMIKDKNPRIVLCSMQYRESVRTTFGYFFQNRFFAYVHWLNPGYSDENPYEDGLGLIPYIQSNPSQMEIRDGKIEARGRVEEMRMFIREWAMERGLVVNC